MTYYDRIVEEQDGDFATFIGEKKRTSTMRSGREVEPYEYVDQDRVTVTLPRKSWRPGVPALEPATVNWSALGSRDVEHATAYGSLIVFAARFAAVANEKAGV